MKTIKSYSIEVSFDHSSEMNNIYYWDGDSVDTQTTIPMWDTLEEAEEEAERCRAWIERKHPDWLAHSINIEEYIIDEEIE